MKENDAKISSLELRMEDLEKKFKEQKKIKDKKIKELENAIKFKSSNEKATVNSKEIFKCSECDFETNSKRGLSVHIKRKHTNLIDETYPKECDFCDSKLKNEKEMKMHLKVAHTYKEAKFKCEDCDFYGGNELSVEVHHGKCHSVDFECGLCDYKAKSLENLNTHLTTCESYECDACYFRVKTLKEIENHLQEKHTNENLNIIHGKLDRKDENFINTSEHSNKDLFPKSN